MRQRRKNKMIIMSLLGFLFLMTVGYAAFQTNLKIKGTSSISSNWDIRITNVTEGNKTGDAESAKAPTWDKLTANVEANLYQKGDSIEYIITVENKGTIDAFLSNITTNETKHEAIKFTVEGPNSNDKLFKGESTRIKVKIEYNPEFNGVPEVGSSELNITLDYVQAVVAGNEILNQNLYVSSTGNDKTGVGSTTNPYKTLQKAYEEAGNEATIYIMDDITQTETFYSYQNKNITLTSYGVNHSIIRASTQTSYLIEHSAGTLTLENITIDGNEIEAQRSLINVESDLNLNHNSIIKNGYNTTTSETLEINGGGLILKNGTLTINGGIITNNKAGRGGGIYIINNKKAILNSGKISYNEATYGGGVAGIIEINGGEISHNQGVFGGGINGKIEMNGGEISYNKTTTNGGGGVISGTIKGGSIHHNESVSGAGLIIYNASFEMTGGTISDNVATKGGGGVLVGGTTSINANFTMTGGIITNNKALMGAGIYISSASTLTTINGGVIKNNLGTSSNGGIYAEDKTKYKYLKGIICGNSPTNSFETSTSCPS